MSEQQQQEPHDEPEDKFTPLCNLLHTIGCEHAELDIEQAGDILYYDANPMVCPHSSLMALAIFAYLGVPTGNTMLDADADQLAAAMRDGGGTFESGNDNDDEDGSGG